MGLMDRRAALLEDKAAEKEARTQARSEVVGKMFEVEKNRGSVNAAVLEERINTMWHKGYDLDKLHEANGDTLMVFRRRD